MLYTSSFFFFASEMNRCPIPGFGRGKAAEMFSVFGWRCAGGLLEGVRKILAGALG